jgi:hypothetical protein
LVPFIILFVPEHAFNREAAMEREEKSQTPGFSSDTSSGTPNTNGAQKLRNSQQIELDEWLAAQRTHPHGWGPFLPQLRLFTGRKSDEPFWKILLRPFPLYLHPAVAWGSITQGTLIAFLVAISTVIAEIFGGPPHFFSNSKVGFFYTGPFIGGIIGFIVGISPSPPINV